MIACSFNAFARGGSDFDLICAPLNSTGGSLGKRHVSGRKELAHLLNKVSGLELSADQLVRFVAGRGVSGQISEEDYRTYFPK